MSRPLATGFIRKSCGGGLALGVRCLWAAAAGRSGGAVFWPRELNAEKCELGSDAFGAEIDTMAETLLIPALALPPVPVNPKRLGPDTDTQPPQSKAALSSSSALNALVRLT